MTKHFSIWNSGSQEWNGYRLLPDFLSSKLNLRKVTYFSITILLSSCIFAAEPSATNQVSGKEATVRLLADLQKSLSGTTNVFTGFVQEKQMAMLQQKVIIKGQLAVQQPGLFAWHVDEPIKYNLVIDGSNLRQWDEATGKEQKMSLRDNPVFEVVSRQLRAWFGGQFESLLKDFDAESNPATPRSVVFTPNKDSFARKAIKRVELTFREDRRYVEGIVIEELGGDKTVMTFTNTILNATIDPAIWNVKPAGR